MLTSRLERWMRSTEGARAIHPSLYGVKDARYLCYENIFRFFTKRASCLFLGHHCCRLKSIYVVNSDDILLRLPADFIALVTCEYTHKGQVPTRPPSAFCLWFEKHHLRHWNYQHLIILFILKLANKIVKIN
jgi:hypothetical protein